MGDIRANRSMPTSVQTTVSNTVHVNTNKQEITIHNEGNLTINIAEGDQLNVTTQISAGQAIPVQTLEFQPQPSYAGAASPRETYQVLQVLKRAEGNSSDAESALHMLKNSQRSYESLTEASQSYLALLRAEGSGSTSDAMSDYQLIDRSLFPGENRATATQTFLDLLRAEGSSSTSDVQAEYQMIHNSLKPGEDRSYATRTYLSLLRAEGSGSTSDAMSDYRLIHSGLKPGQSRGEATQFFLDVLRSKGSSNTAGAQHEYRLYQ